MTLMPSKFRPAVLLFIIVLLAVVPLGWRINSRGINEWDEARNGVNAYEMHKNHDLINLYYDGAIDTWNAKPPLVIWGIAGAYGIFGYNAFALRIWSAIATVLFFVILYLFLTETVGKRLAFVSSAIMLSCKAAISTHLGLTGDFDAPLMCALLASAWLFWRFSSGGRTKHIYWCALLIGLAWMIKGPAGLLYLPGFALFLVLRSQTLSRRRILHIALAGGILAVIIASWLLIAGKYGKIGIDKSYGKGNALHTMFIEDIWHRMTSSDFQGGQPRNYFFFFETLDSKVNLWNYLFYLSLAVGIVFLVQKRNAFISWLRDAGRGAYLLAACTLVPVFILLTFAANKYDWYLAPVFWIVCLFTARGIVYLQRRWPKLIWLFGAVAVFGYARQLVQINGYAENACWIKTGLMKQADTIIVVGDIPQDIMLQLKWSEKPVVRRELDKLAYEQGQKLIVSDSLTGGIREKMNVLPFTTRGMLFGRPID